MLARGRRDWKRNWERRDEEVNRDGVGKRRRMIYYQSEKVWTWTGNKVMLERLEGLCLE